MSLRETFSTAMKESMKAGDKTRLSTVRMIQAGLKDRDIEARGNGKEPSSDADILSLLQKMIKQTQESEQLAEKAGRQDLVDQARAEIGVLRSFLPKQLGEDEVKDAIAAAIAETGAAGVKDMGKVLAALRERFSGQMDFGKASAAVKQALAG